MKEINFTKLINRRGQIEVSHDYELNESEKYFVRYTKDFFEYNCETCFTIEVLGGIHNQDCYRVIKDFNDFMQTLENKTFKDQQQILKNMWGKQFLWNNKFTRGIVVKLVEPDDTTNFTYQILVECSRECTGFKYVQWIPSDSYTQKAIIEVLSNG